MFSRNKKKVVKNRTQFFRWVGLFLVQSFATQISTQFKDDDCKHHNACDEETSKEVPLMLSHKQPPDQAIDGVGGGGVLGDHGDTIGRVDGVERVRGGVLGDDDGTVGRVGGVGRVSGGGGVGVGGDGVGGDGVVDRVDGARGDDNGSVGRD